MSVEPEQRRAALEGEQLGVPVCASSSVFMGMAQGRLSFPLQALGQGYLAHLSECSVCSWLAEGHRPLGATAAPEMELCGTSCCASRGGSFPQELAVIHGTSSQEEAARLNQCCLGTCAGEGT